MRQRQLRERQLFVGASVDGRREAVRPSDDEHEPPCRSLFLLQPSGQFHAAQLFAVLVEQHHGVLWLYLFEYQFALSRLLLFLRETLGVLELRDGHDIEGHIVADACGIVADACLEMLVVGLANKY